MDVPVLSPGQAVGLNALPLLPALAFSGLVLISLIRIWTAKRFLRRPVRVRNRGLGAGRPRR